MFLLTYHSPYNTIRTTSKAQIECDRSLDQVQPNVLACMGVQGVNFIFILFGKS